MEILADLLMAVAELFEAEMAAARQSVVRLMIAGLMLLASFALVMGVVALVMWGLYALLVPAAGLVGAAFIAAAILLAAALALIFGAKWYAR